MFQRKTKSEFDAFHHELIERFWEIHEMEAYGGPPDFEIPPHKTESQILEMTGLAYQAHNIDI